MPRSTRTLLGGFCYHVINRGNGRARVFFGAADYREFVKLMAAAGDRLPPRLLAYCLMPNHVHLVLWPREDGEVSRWMQWLMTAQVRRHHRRHGSDGHLWQGRFKAFPIQRDEHLLSVLRYVESNPLRAKLVDGCLQQGQQGRESRRPAFPPVFAEVGCRCGQGDGQIGGDDRRQMVTCRGSGREPYRVSTQAAGQTTRQGDGPAIPTNPEMNPLELLGVGFETRDDDAIRAGFTTRQHARKSALTRPEDQDGIARARLRNLDRPAEAIAAALACVARRRCARGVEELLQEIEEGSLVRERGGPDVDVHPALLGR